MKWLTALLLLAVAHFAQAADPTPIGRIFFTPEQRAQLDLLRSQKAVASQVRDEPVPENVTYNGIVRSSDGKTTVWVNNEVLSEADLRNKQSIVGSIGRNGQIKLQASQSAIELKVGQSATLFSGKVEESFTTKPATVDKTKPISSAPSQSVSPPKEIPPELLEALRQAAARTGTATPAPTEKPKTAPSQ